MNNRVYQFVMPDIRGIDNDDVVIWALMPEDSFETISGIVSRLFGIEGTPTDYTEAVPGLDVDLTDESSSLTLVKALHTARKRTRYRAGHFRMPIPPVTTGRWDEDDWIHYIDDSGVWGLPEEPDTIQVAGDTWVATGEKDAQGKKLYRRAELWT